MTEFFFIHHPGHGGGGWLMCIINNHPMPITCTGEIDKDTQLALRGRGLMDQRDKIVQQFLADRIYYGDKSVGMIRSSDADVRFARQHGPVMHVQLVYNPRRRYVQKGRAKKPAAVRWYKQTYGRDMITDREQTEAVAAYFVEHFWEKYINIARRQDWPIIRLEDLNLSLKLETGFFKRFMEWLTGVEWPDEYIDYIREHNTPAYQYYNHFEWEKPPYSGRVTKVVTEQREYMAWANRDNWDPDPFLDRWWSERTDMEKEVWIDKAAAMEKVLGYNRGDKITLEPDWEFRGAYLWGDVYQ